MIHLPSQSGRDVGTLGDPEPLCTWSPCRPVLYTNGTATSLIYLDIGGDGTATLRSASVDPSTSALTAAAQVTIGPSSVLWPAGPVLCADTVYVALGFGLYAYHADTLVQKWAVPKVCLTQFTNYPTAMDEFVLASQADGTVTAFAVEDGHILWSFGGEPGHLPPAPIVSSSNVVAVNGGTTAVYIARTNTGSAYAFAFSLTDGSWSWTYEFADAVPPSGSGAPYLPCAPTVSADSTQVFVPSTLGTVYALDAKDGTELWSYAALTTLSTSPVAVRATDGTNLVYLVDTQGQLYAASKDNKYMLPDFGQGYGEMVYVPAAPPTDGGSAGPDAICFSCAGGATADVVYIIADPTQWGDAIPTQILQNDGQPAAPAFDAATGTAFCTSCTLISGSSINVIDFSWTDLFNLQSGSSDLALGSEATGASSAAFTLTLKERAGSAVTITATATAPITLEVLGTSYALTAGTSVVLHPEQSGHLSFTARGNASDNARLLLSPSFAPANASLQIVLREAAMSAARDR